MYLHKCGYLCMHMQNYAQFSDYKELRVREEEHPLSICMYAVLNCNFYHRKYYIYNTNMNYAFSVIILTITDGRYLSILRLI